MGGLLEFLGLKAAPGKSATASTAPTVGSGAAPNVSASGQNAGAGAGAAPPPVDKNKAAFATARSAVQKLLDGLTAHLQKANIAKQIAQVVAKLGDADAHAAKAEWSEAGKRLVEAKTICVAAKRAADDWAGYVAKRGEALAMAMSFDSADSPEMMAWAMKFINAADGFANATPPAFGAALQQIKIVVEGIRPVAKSLITLVKARLATVEKSDAKVKAFAKADIDEGKAFIAQSDKAFADSDWSLCRTTAISALRLLGPAVRLCEQRTLYEAQRVLTVAAIAKVKGAPSVQSRAAAIDAVVAEADALASYETRKFQEGVRVLQGAAATAATWSGLASTVAAYGKERPAADGELAALDKHAAAAKIAKEREAIRKLLVDAQGLASSADAAADPTSPWNSALAAVTRARADLALAAKLADGLGTASAAEAAAAKPGDAAGMKAALDKLRADGKLAAKAPHAAQASAEFKRFDDSVAATDKALTGNDNAGAAKALAEAAQALAAAKAIQAEHAQFATMLVSVEAQLKKLQASPRAAVIKARVDPVAVALADAKAKDKAHAGPEAMAALRAANDAVAAATLADKERETFDTGMAALAKRIVTIKDATQKAALDKSVVDAKKLADAFSFADATAAQKKIEVSLDKTRLEAMMKSKADDPNIAKTAAKMVDNGGASTVDAMIQAVPDGGDPRLVNNLAQGRYGIKFKTGKAIAADPKNGIAAGDEAKAMKAVCAMFEKIPQDVRKNPSVRGVSHDDAVGTAGGAHDYDTAQVTLNGRPKAFAQEFGAAQKNVDPKTNAATPELPAAIDDAAKPADPSPVDYLGFAAAHEVGHGVDDARGFMRQNGAGVKFGGWITYGSSLQPLADIIGADARFKDFYQTAEQRKYILDKLSSRPAAAPPSVAASKEDVAQQAFDLWYSIATATDVYRRQSDCDAIKIGDRVYHEAYARTWVSYLASARNQALTGYQFRAPGEWFAELYAGYRSGKLKPEHPSMDWLKKL